MTATTRFRRVHSCAPQPYCPRARRPFLVPRRETASGTPSFGRSDRHAPVSERSAPLRRKTAAPPRRPQAHSRVFRIRRGQPSPIRQRGPTAARKIDDSWRISWRSPWGRHHLTTRRRMSPKRLRRGRLCRRRTSAWEHGAWLPDAQTVASEGLKAEISK